MVGATRFEHATSWSQTKRSNQTELRPDEQDRFLCVYNPKLYAYKLLTCLFIYEKQFEYLIGGSGGT